MKTFANRICLLAIAALALFSYAAPSNADSGFKLDETGSVDFARFIAKAEKMFFSGEFAEKHPEAARVKFFLEKLGILDFDKYNFEFHLGQGKLSEKCSLTLDQKKDTSLLAQLSNLPDREIKIGKVLNPASALVSVSVMNPVEKLELFYKAASDPALWDEIEDIAGPDADIEQARLAIGMADFMLAGIGGFDAIKSYVGGELDLMLLELPEGDLSSPDYPWDDLVVFGALELDDTDEFLKTAGPMAAQVFQGEPAFTASNIKFYPAGGPHHSGGHGFIGVGKGFLLAGSNGARLKEILDSRYPSIKPVTANAYVRVDVNTLWHKHLAKLTESDFVPYPKHATAMHKEFWDIAPDTDFGALEFAWHAKPNEFSWEMTAKEEFVNLFAMVYTWVMAVSFSESMKYADVKAPEYGEMPPAETASADPLYEIQNALEGYFADNGQYPREAEELVQQGYMLGRPVGDELLAEFPINQFTGEPMVSRWPRDWSAGDFCYRPYIVDGVASGYYLMLFGSDKYSGMDVVSPLNALENRMWKPDTDGKPDGIAYLFSGGDVGEAGGEADAAPF